MSARRDARRIERSARNTERYLILAEVIGSPTDPRESDSSDLLALLTRRDLALRAGAEHTAAAITDALIDAVWGPSVA